MAADKSYGSAHVSGSAVHQGDSRVSIYVYASPQTQGSRDPNAVVSRAAVHSEVTQSFAERESSQFTPADQSARDNSSHKGSDSPQRAFPQPAASNERDSDWKKEFSKNCAKKGCSDWSNSLMDLLKGLDLPSGFSTRSQLAKALQIRVEEDGHPDQNVALRKKVMAELENYDGKLSPALQKYKAMTATNQGKTG